MKFPQTIAFPQTDRQLLSKAFLETDKYSNLKTFSFSKKDRFDLGIFLGLAREIGDAKLEQFQLMKMPFPCI